MAQLNFDATQVQPNAGQPDPIPANWYNMMIDESEMKPTKDGAGMYLQLRFTVIDGQYANRKVYARLNLRNSNQQAQDIAYGELSAICHSIGVLRPQDSQELHGKPLKVKVKYRGPSNGYEASNDIGGYKNINEPIEVPASDNAQHSQTGGFGGQPPQQQQQPQQAPQQAQWQTPAAQQPWQQEQAPAQQAPAQQAPQQQPQQPWQQPQTQQPQQQAPQQPPQQTQPWEQQAQQAPQQQQQTAPNGMPPWAQQ